MDEAWTSKGTANAAKQSKEMMVAILENDARVIFAAVGGWQPTLLQFLPFEFFKAECARPAVIFACFSFRTNTFRRFCAFF